MTASILLVDDDVEYLRAVSALLHQHGYEVLATSSAPEALELMRSRDVDVMLTDMAMPVIDGLQLLEQLRKDGDLTPVILVSGVGSIETATRALKLGAVDFLEKPVSPQRLFVTLESTLRYGRLARTTADLQSEMGLRRQLTGDSPVIQRLRQQIEQIAPTDGRVLVFGENGTGKEVVASALHHGSQRRREPFIRLNCGAVPAELIESELFGHERGSFTGAVAARKGRFELADRGTLFLDEIGDMPVQMQVKLLRVLQEGTFERVGGGRTIQTDVRVLAATNHDLQRLVEEGLFREDLYYRLKVVTLRVPPLRERRGDIPALLEQFIAEAARRTNRPPIELSSAALERVKSHSFPGNVRELQNLIEGLTILCAHPRVEVEDVEQLLGETGRGRAEPPSLYAPGRGYRQLVEDAERAIITAAVSAHANSRAAAAQALGLDRSHFYRKCRQLGITGGRS